MIEGGWSPATGAPRGPLAGLPAAYARPSTAANAGLGQLLWAKAASLTPAGAKGKKASMGVWVAQPGWLQDNEVALVLED